MSCPCIKINLNKIADNAIFINDRCVQSGISVIGVTKSILADINIVKTLKKSGIKIFGDSRLLNLKKLRNYFGYGQELVMLRTPMLSECEDLLDICDTSFQTELETVRLLSQICSRKKITHNIVIMIEMDDRREGINPAEAFEFFDKVYRNYKNINITGLGTNARCISKKKPRLKSIENLISLRDKIKEIYNYRIPIISGGNSSLWNYISSGTLPDGVNQVRLGEAILIGNETAGYEKIEGLYDDCFTLECEVIEVKERKGEIYKAILALGLQDVSFRHITIKDPFYKIVGQSSDHTVLELKKEFYCFKSSSTSQDSLASYDNFKNSSINYPTSFTELNVGSIINFKLDYFGLLSCMTSPFVIKKYIGA